MIRFEFHGGFTDGQVVSGNASRRDEATPMLLRYLYFTDGGRIGARFDELAQSDREAEEKRLRSLLDSLFTNDPNAVQLREALSQRLSSDDAHAVRRLLELLRDPVYAKDPHVKQRLLTYIIECLGWPMGHFLRDTYEVTKREERPDEIVIRLDLVEPPKP